MSGAERTRTLSESSEETETLNQEGAQRMETDQESLTEVTDSDSESSSSDSSSDSSSSSSEDEEGRSGKENPETQNISQPAEYQETISEGLSQEPLSDLALPSNLDLAQDKNIESWMGLGDILLSNSDPAAGSGPVDPVFVDHEDSQHATQMDSLVFDSQADDDKSVDDMNEPRLESVCNSTLASTDNSIILGNDLEDSDENMEEEERGEPLKLRIDKTKMVVTPLSPEQLDNDEKKKIKKKKKERKRKKSTLESDSELEDNPRIDASLVPRTSKKSKLSQCHTQQKEIQSKPKETTKVQEVIKSKPNPSREHSKSTVSAETCTNMTKSCSSSSSRQNQKKTVPAPPPPVQDPREEKAPAPPPEADRKNKKLTVRDYKAKKEAERLRRSLESSDSKESSQQSSPSESPLTVPMVEVKVEDDEDLDVKVPVPSPPSKTSLPVETGGAFSADLAGFDVLDEIEDADSDNDISKDSDSDSLAEDEVHQMLEQDVPVTENQAKDDIQPQEKLTKLVLEERGQNVFEVLPLGWVSVTHNSGMPLYLHRETRVVTASKPYDIGNGSVRKHNIPISAVPCYAYKYYSPAQSQPTPTPATATAGKSCPYSSKSSFRENASPDSTTEPPTSDPTGKMNTNMFPKAQIESIEETMKDTELTPEQLTEYCKNVFVFKELEVAKFKTWKERRAYLKQSQKKKIEKELINRPTLPEGTKIITIPALELSNISVAEGDTALNQKVVKKSKKKWIINPVGKSTVCLLHEYVQQSLKTQPYYDFTELDNAATPYAATVKINEIEYGRGTGSSKKIAKSEAARRTLEMLIPEIKDKLPSVSGEADGDGPDLSFFDEIRVEDPRVADLCNRTSEPAPYQILVTCLQRNYGLGDTHIHQDMKTVRNGKNEYRLLVNKREVVVICKNKKDGKQLAAQKLLHQLHPHINSWGSLLRMYGNRSLRKLKIKKEKETEVTGLQTRNSQASVAPSLAILDKLREEMKNLRESRQNIVPIGKFVLPDGIGQTGLNTDHVDL